MKRLIAMAIVALTAIEFVSAAPEVTDITAKQRYQWNGLVDITCKVSGIEADAGGYEFAVVAVNLNSKCGWTWTTVNGVNGYVIQGIGDYASHNIFLPCAGYALEGSWLYNAGSHGYYLSSGQNWYGMIHAWFSFFCETTHQTNYYYEYYYNGLTVRPVQ